MPLSPVVNTDVKMPKKMLNALSLHETVCAVTNVHSVTEESIKAYLTTKFGADLAEKFKPEYLFNTPKL